MPLLSKNPECNVPYAFALQVILKRISPVAIAVTSAGTQNSGRSGKSGTQSSAGGDSVDSESRAVGAAAAAAQLMATAPGEVDGWAPPMAADALLIRGRLALLDGKLRVGDFSIQPGPDAPIESSGSRLLHLAVTFE